MKQQDPGPRWFSLLTGTYVEPPKKTGGSKFGYGCNSCPLERTDQHRFLSEYRDSSVMVWGHFPDRSSAERQLPFRGEGGRWFRRELKQLGFPLGQLAWEYVLRCRPGDRDGVYRPPDRRELHHCSLYNRRAIDANPKARVHLLLGQEAAMQVLKAEYSAETPVMWSEKLQARVFCLDSPDLLCREDIPHWRIDEFRDKLRFARWCIDHPGKWDFLETCDFGQVTRYSSAVRLFDHLREIASSGERITADIETGRVDGEPALLCIGFSWGTDCARTVFLDHPQNPADQREREQVYAALQELLEGTDVPWVFHFGSSDVDALRQFGIRVKKSCFTFDTYYASYLKRTYLRKHGLDALSNTLYPQYAGYKEIIRPYVSSHADNYADIPLDVMTLYNCADAALTKRIEQDTRDTVNLALLKTYTYAGFTVDRMEDRGPTLDQRYLDAVVGVLPQRIKTLEKELRLLAGNPDFNPNAPDQIAGVLYDQLGLEAEDGSRSTAEETLNVLYQSTQHPFIKAVQEYRKYTKMESTYVSKYRHSAKVNHGELRSKWYLAGTITGRLRSGGAKEGLDDRINLQNLHGSAFLQNLLISDPGWYRLLKWDITKPVPEELLDLEVFLAGDYSQIEIRMLAECSGDKKLIAQFRKAAEANPSDPRSDIHCLVGAGINPAWSLEFIKKDKPTRTFVKNCHFGMVFGLDAHGLFYYLKAKGVDTSEEQAAEFHENYFKRYVGVAEFIERMRAFARKHGYVETIFGFVRMVGGSWEPDRKTSPENQAINSPIQGAAHTLLISAMAMLFARGKNFKVLQRLIMEVHDALVWRVRLRDLPTAYATAKHLLERAVPEYVLQTWGRELRVPLFSEFSAGFRYGVLADYAGQPVDVFLRTWLEKNAKVSETVKAEFGV